MQTPHMERKKILPIALLVALLGCVLSWRWADGPVSHWLLGANGLWIDTPLILGFRQLGKGWAPVWLLLLWVTVTGRSRPATTAMLAMLFTIALVLPLKEWVGRLRPGEYIDTPLEEGVSLPAVGHSFPSGDMATVCAVTFSLVCVLSWRVWSVLLGISLIIGVLRLVVFAHHLSDVCAGAAVGILCADLALRVDHSGFFDSRRLDRRPWLAWLGLGLVPVLWCLEAAVSTMTFAVTVAPVAVLIAIRYRWRLTEGAADASANAA